MSQLKHGGIPTPQQQAQSQALGDPVAEDLQHVNDDAAAARHLTAIRIRGQLAEGESEAAQG